MKRMAELEHMTLGKRFEMRCYREHDIDSEKLNCKGKHMRYEGRVDFGVFT